MTRCNGWILAALVSGSLILPGTAFAAGGESADYEDEGPSSTLDLNYKLFIGGIPLGRIDVSTRIRNGTYNVSSSLETEGIVNSFWQSRIEATSSGLLQASAFLPSVYDSYYQGPKGKRQQVTLSFGPEGPIGLFADPPYKVSKYPVTDEQKRATIDPLSAVVYVTTGMTADAGNPCGSAAPVFDGRRRYDIVLEFREEERIKMDNGLYEGPAFRCQLIYKQIAGFKPKILKEGQNFPPIYAWIVPFDGKIDATRRYYVPLRIWADTDYGMAVAVVSRFKLDGDRVRDGPG